MRAGIALTALLLASQAFGQNLSPQKDIMFGQLAAGGGYETLLTLTNRGTTVYNGTLKFFTGAQGNPWSPQVNGAAVTAGTLALALQPGETRSLRITLPGSTTESAFGVAAGSSMEQTSFIEGNLTYFTYASGSARTMTESVGVPPSGEFFRATLPFEDFSTIALALANLNRSSANITLTVYNELSALTGTNSLAALGRFGHSVGFLWQYFPGLTMGRGRLEITSDVPVAGTALTFINGLVSSLPLLPSPASYTFASTISGLLLEGEIGIWAEGPFTKGYLRLTKGGGTAIPPENYLFSGQLQEGTLRASGYGTSAALGGQQLSVFVEVTNFSFLADRPTGSLTLGNPATGQTVKSTIQLVRVR
jgi:hypothetical protein